MADIKPFRALRFSNSNLTKLIAPPYDVISREKREELLARDPHNTIRLTLGDPSTMTAAELSDPTRYTNAAQTLKSWRKEKIVAQETEPSLYVIEDTFPWQGKELKRRGILATVRLQEFGKGKILPHERTLALPIEDRMKLMEATQTHLSPIYMVFEDARKQVRSWIDAVAKQPPEAEFSNPDEPIRHRFWKISDPALIDSIVKLLAPKSFLIADGHHRYTTALHYFKNHGKEQPESEWMLTYLAPAPDDGVVLSAIHRIFETSIDVQQWIAGLADEATIEPQHLSWDAFIESGAPLAIVSPKTTTMHVLRPHISVYAEIPTDLQDVPSVVLNEWIVQRHLGLDLTNPDHQKKVRYIKKAEEVGPAIEDETDLGFWLRPLSVLDVLTLTQNGHLLPQKSTFFYPKVMSGFAFHDLGHHT